MSNFLTKILAHKYREVEEQSGRESLDALKRKVAAAAAPLDFEGALRHPRVAGEVALIAEIKKASPSKGLLCPDFDPATLAAAYSRGGASALSVLTDEEFFQGHLSYLQIAKEAAGGEIPVLRKDFIVAPYQVWQARAYGADALLLIMAALTDAQAAELFTLATELGLGALVEVHNRPELERALKLGARIIGVNNRDLHTFQVDLGTTGQLAASLPPGFNGILVSESGIASHNDIESLYRQGARAVLIGETLVRAASTGGGLDTTKIQQKIRELFG
ncbi:MAG TPA: indole-3-glycerol phosphate synthase TrpC [Chloroflexia bacterium]|nr:indole-3-glycerol phosphate synthase TrpC [Chloroflexia bacterium]